MVPFVDAINKCLENECSLDEEILEKTYYLYAEWDYYEVSSFEGWSFNNLKLLDKNGNDLNIAQEDIQSGEFLDNYFENWLNSGIGQYLKENPKFRIKYEI